MGPNFFLLTPANVLSVEFDLSVSYTRGWKRAIQMTNNQITITKGEDNNNVKGETRNGKAKKVKATGS